MQLLLCSECRDVFKLVCLERSCFCGRVIGLRTEYGVAHFTGPAIPMEIPDVGLKSALSQEPPTNGNRVRMNLYLISPDEVSDGDDRWRKKHRKYKPRKKKRNMPAHAKPWRRKKKRV